MAQTIPILVPGMIVAVQLAAGKRPEKCPFKGGEEELK